MSMLSRRLCGSFCDAWGGDAVQLGEAPKEELIPTSNQEVGPCGNFNDDAAESDLLHTVEKHPPANHIPAQLGSACAAKVIEPDFVGKIDDDRMTPTEHAVIQENVICG